MLKSDPRDVKNRLGNNRRGKVTCPSVRDRLVDIEKHVLLFFVIYAKTIWKTKSCYNIKIYHTEMHDIGHRTNDTSP